MVFKYHEIMDHVINEISRGTYRTKLPSIRGMAIRFSCSNSTVIKAYSELEEQGIIYSAPKSGYFINQNQKENNKEYDFFSGIPQSSYLPYESMEKAYLSSLKENTMQIFNYSYSRGDLRLRDFLAQEAGGNTSRDQVIMLNGTQQFTSAVVAYCQNHKVELLIEDPTYNLMVGAMRTFAHVVKTVKRTIQGLDLDALEAMAKNGEFKFFFTMAHNHNPLGTSLSKEEKTRLIDLARRYDFYIIEDDYLKDLSTKEESLFAMAPDVVIYLRSFSKTVSPSLRLCALIIPPALVHDLGDTFGFLNTGASSLNQDVLLRYLKSKASEKHNRLLRERTSEKCQTLKKALKDCPYPYYVPDCGLYAYIELPEGFRTMELLEVMDDKDMRFRSDLEFSFNRDINGLRISLSRVEKRAIETAIPVLIQEMKQITTALPQSKDIYL